MTNFTTDSMESQRELKNRSPPILDLHHFPALEGSFQENMMNFLGNCCIQGGGETRFWMSYVFDKEKQVILPIYIIKDLQIKDLSIQNLQIDDPNCGFHGTKEETYNILIPAEDRWSKPDEDLNLNEDLNHLNLVVDTHLLHGLIHNHGCHHLDYIKAGTSILDNLINDIWTRLCSILSTGPGTNRGIY